MYISRNLNVLAGQTLNQSFRRKGYLQINAQFQNIFRLVNFASHNKIEEISPISSAFVGSV